MERHNKPSIKNSSTTPTTLSLSAREGIKFLANLIIDRIIEDQKNGSELYRKATR